MLRCCPRTRSPVTPTTFTPSRWDPERHLDTGCPARGAPCAQTRGRLCLPRVQQGHKFLTRAVRFPSLSFFLESFPDRLETQGLCSFSVIPLLGTIFADDRASYQYLVALIRRFSSQGDFARMIGEAGLATGGDFEGDGGRGGICGRDFMHTHRREKNRSDTLALFPLSQRSVRFSTSFDDQVLVANR